MATGATQFTALPFFRRRFVMAGSSMDCARLPIKWRPNSTRKSLPPLSRCLELNHLFPGGKDNLRSTPDDSVDGPEAFAWRKNVGMPFIGRGEWGFEDGSEKKSLCRTIEIIRNRQGSNRRRES